MKRNTRITATTKKLDRARTKYINAQIKAESGFSGTLIKLGFRSIKEDKGLGYLLEAQKNYYAILNQYRKLVVGEFRKNNRKIISNDIKMVAKLTIFDEVRKVRKEKEEKLRRKGLKGIIRTQLQEWRQISTGFKMGMGLMLSIMAVILSFVSAVEIHWLQVPLLGWGIIIFLEGAQQKMSRSKAAKKGMNRPVAYKRAERRLSRIKSNLVENLAKIHMELEANIWQIRVFEKKTEYRRYIIAGIGGGLIGSIYLMPYGVTAVVVNSTVTVLSRGIWFLLPYGAIRGGLSSLFSKSAPQVAAAAEAVKMEQAEVQKDVNAGEGLETVAADTRASTADPAYVKAMQGSNLNKSLIADVGAVESAKNKFGIATAKAASLSESDLNGIIDQMKDNPVSLFYSGPMSIDERKVYIGNQDADYVRSVLKDNIRALTSVSPDIQAKWANNNINNDQSFWDWLYSEGFIGVSGDGGQA
ncbi:MAG: hypothetical protein U9Q72_00520, partial [Patescibacteria group bacterium]|nr:hypothetical protein [Patescibacteria group bacterium]